MKRSIEIKWNKTFSKKVQKGVICSLFFNEHARHDRTYLENVEIEILHVSVVYVETATLHNVQLLLVIDNENEFESVSHKIRMHVFHYKNDRFRHARINMLDSSIKTLIINQLFKKHHIMVLKPRPFCWYYKSCTNKIYKPGILEEYRISINWPGVVVTNTIKWYLDNWYDHIRVVIKYD
jgi:hypothetical protein